jgi:hypothetical protein
MGLGSIFPVPLRNSSLPFLVFHEVYLFNNDLLTWICCYVTLYFDHCIQSINSVVVKFNKWTWLYYCIVLTIDCYITKKKKTIDCYIVIIIMHIIFLIVRNLRIFPLYRTNKYEVGMRRYNPIMQQGPYTQMLIWHSTVRLVLPSIKVDCFPSSKMVPLSCINFQFCLAHP